MQIKICFRFCPCCSLPISFCFCDLTFGLSAWLVLPCLYIILFQLEMCIAVIIVLGLFRISAVHVNISGNFSVCLQYFPFPLLVRVYSFAGSGDSNFDDRT